MRRMGRWIAWLLILEFLLFFVIGLRIQREMARPRVHFVQAPVDAAPPGSPGLGTARA